MSVDEQYAAAVTAQANGQYPQVMNLLNSILDESPRFVPGWNLRGMCLAALGHPFDAIMNYDRAIALSPEVADFYSNRSSAHADKGNFTEALADCARALYRNSKIPEVYLNRGNYRRRLGQIKLSADEYRKAIELRPSYVDAHLGLSFSLLELGLYEEGWKEYEWRWKSEQLVPRGTAPPSWNWEGERCKDQNEGLLIYGEQGFGDVLQFMRYTSLAKKAWWGKVYLAVKLPLARVARSLPGVDGVLVVGEKLPPNIVKSTVICSLPRILGTQEGFAVPAPYMMVDRSLVSIWRERLKALPPGLRIGVCWAGLNRTDSPLASAIDTRRSMMLADFAPLAKVPGISWVSLQKGARSDQVRLPPSGMVVGDWTDDFYDFADTAALVSCLDLVISVDTAIVHLAGAVNTPTWMLSRYDGCWRWLGDRRDSPWYPKMVQFRQKKDGAWPEVMERVQRELITLVQGAQIAA